MRRSAGVLVGWLAGVLLLAQALLLWHGYTQHGLTAAAIHATASHAAGDGGSHRVSTEEAACAICLSGAALGRALDAGPNGLPRLALLDLVEQTIAAAVAPVPGAVSLPPYGSRAPPAQPLA